MAEVRKRRHLMPEEKSRAYNDAPMSRDQGNVSIAEVLKRWDFHSSDLTRITRTVEEGFIATFKAKRSRKPKVRLSEDEIMALKSENERLEKGLLEFAEEVALLKRSDRLA